MLPGMARVTPVPEAPGAAAFELERFEWAAPDRLEVVGRWSGIRGRRFVRPTLTLRGDGGAYRLLALLDHKPWPASEGESWVAAFPWDGEPLAFETAELAVATGIELELPPPGTSGRATEGLFRAVTRVPEPDALPAEERAGRERAHALELMKERDRVVAERDEALGALRAAALELDALAVERDGLSARLETAERERDEARVERERLRADRDAAVADLEAARSAREKAAAERDRAEIERDRARREMPGAQPETDPAETIRELQRERDAAIRARDAAVGARPPAPRPVSPILPGEMRMSPLALWAPRLVALGIFVLLLLALLVLLGS